MQRRGACTDMRYASGRKLYHSGDYKFQFADHYRHSIFYYSQLLSSQLRYTTNLQRDVLSCGGSVFFFSFSSFVARGEYFTELDSVG